MVKQESITIKEEPDIKKAVKKEEEVIFEIDFYYDGGFSPPSRGGQEQTPPSPCSPPAAAVVAGSPVRVPTSPGVVWVPPSPPCPSPAEIDLHSIYEESDKYSRAHKARTPNPVPLNIKSDHKPVLSANPQYLILSPEQPVPAAPWPAAPPTPTSEENTSLKNELTHCYGLKQEEEEELTELQDITDLLDVPELGLEGWGQLRFEFSTEEVSGVGLLPNGDKNPADLDWMENLVRL